METYLRHVNQTVEFKTSLEKIDLVVNVEFNGSSEYKDLNLLVIMSLKWPLCLTFVNFSAWPVTTLTRLKVPSSLGFNLGRDF